MHKVNLSQVPVEEHPPSPSGRFRSFSQNISIALGHIKDSDSKANSYPFDLEICQVPPGVSSSPYHAHSGQSELYLILSGSGKFRSPIGLTELTSGDAVYCGPGEPHQIINDGEKDLVTFSPQANLQQQRGRHFDRRALEKNSRGSNHSC